MQDGSALTVGASVASTATIPRNPLARIWDRWKRAAHAIGVVQTRILMFGIYVVVVLPLGMVFRVARDPLHLRPQAHGNWTPCHDEKPTIDRARQQF